MSLSPMVNTHIKPPSTASPVDDNDIESRILSFMDEHPEPTEEDVNDFAYRLGLEVSDLDSKLLSLLEDDEDLSPDLDTLDSDPEFDLDEEDELDDLEADIDPDLDTDLELDDLEEDDSQ